MNVWESGASEGTIFLGLVREAVIFFLAVRSCSSFSYLSNCCV